MAYEYLEHHGILGQRWGVRRYQNADGTLTNAGKKRLYKYDKRLTKINNDIQKDYEKYSKPKDILYGKYGKGVYGSRIILRQEEFDKIKSRGEKILEKHLKTRKNDPLTMDDYFQIASAIGVSKKKIDSWKKELSDAEVKENVLKKVKSNVAEQTQMQIQQEIQLQTQLQIQQQVQQQIQLQTQLMIHQMNMQMM